MKRLIVVLSLAVVASACASAPTDTAQSPSSTPSSDARTSEATEPSEAVPTPVLEGPPAPDFTTQLASGESYTLSEAVTPVYMVFWAEW